MRKILRKLISPQFFKEIRYPTAAWNQTEKYSNKENGKETG